MSGVVSVNVSGPSGVVRELREVKDRGTTLGRFPTVLVAIRSSDGMWIPVETAVTLATEFGMEITLAPKFSTAGAPMVGRVRVSLLAGGGSTCVGRGGWV